MLVRGENPVKILNRATAIDVAQRALAPLW
jgi:hypothetical protein